MGIKEACRIYGVPKTTVHDRISGKVANNEKPKVGPDPILGREAEEKLKTWVLDMAKCGFPINKKELLESVANIVRDTNIKNPFKDGVPGDTWYQAFLRRHPDVNVREPEGINNARAAVTENRVRFWFKDLKEYMKSIDALDVFDDPSRIFNGDETGFSLCPKSGKVLGPRGYKNLYIIKKTNDKENISVLIVFSADGKICPPLVIFPYVRPPKTLIESMPPTWILGRSESGWMKRRKETSYFWHEGLGSKGSTEIGTCVYKFLEKVAEEHPNSDVIFYSDNCCGQQKNRYVFSMYYYAVENLAINSFVKQDYKRNLLLKAVSKDQAIEKTLKEFNMKDLVFALCQSWNALPSSTITSSWKKLWPDIVATPTNDPQISVPSEVIEQIASETQISSNDLETWFRGMDKEENIFHEMSDEEIIKEISSYKTINEEDDDEVIATTPQVTTEDAINAFELGLEWAEANGASYNELLLLRRLRDKALISRFNNVKQKKIDEYFHAC
ncbi:unnamed protein product, partial [Brenthis ino]